MKTFSGILLVIFLSFSMQAQADELFTRCHGQFEYAGYPINIQLLIEIPKSTDQGLFSHSIEEKKIQKINSIPVGIGTITLTEQVGDSKEAQSSFKEDFIVTHLPDSKNRLMVGFFFRQSSVNVLKVDLMGENKPYQYYDTFSNKVLRGFCE